MIDFKWRRVPESNRCTRICNPLRHHSANSPLALWCCAFRTWPTDVQGLFEEKLVLPLPIYWPDSTKSNFVPIQEDFAGQA